MPGTHEWCIVLWFHDESTFYANDQHKQGWKRKDTNCSALYNTKGEGALQIVANFVSADYGWLWSPDGKEEAHVLFKAGKNWEGYFTNEDILDQANKAMDILDKHYPHDGTQL